MSVDIVTGGAGFIGSHLVERLLGEGRRVRVLDNLSNGNLANLAAHDGNRALEVLNVDLADAAAVEGTIPPGARVFHLAALADIVPSIEKPDAYFRSNVMGTFNVLQQARQNQAQRFVYAASSTCYGIPDSFPTPETAEIRPQCPYALT